MCDLYSPVSIFSSVILVRCDERLSANDVDLRLDEGDLLNLKSESAGIAFQIGMTHWCPAAQILGRSLRDS